MTADAAKKNFSEQFRMPQRGRSATLLLPGPAGAIEAVLAAPAQPREPAGIALVCHPHPLYGGALSNKVAYTLAATALKAGLHALRFNFRGVGKSGGVHDQGRGETEDVLFLARQLRLALPHSRLLLAGFSFGAHVSLRAAAAAQADLLIGIAPPLGEEYFPPGAPPLVQPECPWLVIHSRDDEVVPYGETAAALGKFVSPADLVAVDGAGHFFNGCLGLIGEHALPFIERHWPSA